MKKRKNKFPLTKILFAVLGSTISFLVSSLLHSNGSTGSNIVTTNELSRLSGSASIPMNDSIRTLLDVSSRLLLVVGFYFAWLALSYLFKFILSIKVVKDFLNKLFGGK